VINAAFDVRHWNRLDKMQTFLVLSAQSRQKRVDKGQQCKANSEQLSHRNLLVSRTIPAIESP
jgi:hypothetical protein